jgi:adenylate kinase family enzyme
MVERNSLSFIEDPATIKRIHIIGGPGSGKSTLAHELGQVLGLPVYSLDDIAFTGQDFVEEPLEVRIAQVSTIAAGTAWISEGIFVGWISDLLRAANLIIYLDSVPWHTAARRIVVRFVHFALQEAGRQPGHRKFTRFHDYSRHIRQLWAVMFTSRAYYNNLPSRGTTQIRHVTRQQTMAELETYANKVVCCRTAKDLSELIAQLRVETEQTRTNPLNVSNRPIRPESVQVH